MHVELQVDGHPHGHAERALDPADKGALHRWRTDRRGELAVVRLHKHLRRRDQIGVEYGREQPRSPEVGRAAHRAPAGELAVHYQRTHWWDSGAPALAQAEWEAGPVADLQRLTCTLVEVEHVRGFRLLGGHLQARTRAW